MKTKLFYFLLFVSTIVTAQWTQVGNTQFTSSFADNAEFTFDSSGTPFVVYEHPAGNAIYVEKFDGTNWVSVGNGNAISTENYNDLEITVNPVTNQPWIALKSAQSGADSNIDLFSFDGTNWVSEGNNIGGNFFTRGIFLNFDSSGTPRISAIISNGSPNRKPIFYTQQSSGSWASNAATASGNESFFDAFSFDEYMTADRNADVKRGEVGGSSTTILNESGKQFRDVSAYKKGSDYFYAVNDITNNTIQVGNTGGAMSQPSGVSNRTLNMVKFRPSVDDNYDYLMFSNSANQLTFQQYIRDNNTWNVLPSVGISTNTSNFFARMEMNPQNGDLYILYKDGSRISMQRYQIDPPPPALSKFYVDANVSGGNGSGDSWANAMSTLQQALLSADEGVTTEIWMAAGTYIPTGSGRRASFEININGLKIYGGFDGTETTLGERDIQNNPTLLSGDLNGNDNPLMPSHNQNTTRYDNSYNVVTIDANNVILDGLRIEDGYANQDNNSEDTYGASILIREMSENLIIRNCEINDHFSLAGGLRAYFNVDTNLTIENCKFNNNHGRYASGIYILVKDNKTVTVNLINSLFSNSSTLDIYNGGSGFTGSSAWLRANTAGSNLTSNIVNCTFVNNEDNGTRSDSEKGSLAFSRRTAGNSTHNVYIHNSIFYNNKRGSSTTPSVNRGHVSAANYVEINNSIGEDNFSNQTYLTNTSNADPLFADATNNDFTLTASSPAIDNGDNSKIPSGVLIDLLGNNRIHNNTVDMGVYEFGSSPLSVFNNQIDEVSTITYPNPVTDYLKIKSNTIIKKVQLFNLLGKMVLEKEGGNEINLSNLKSGIYLIQIHSENGLVAKKIIKQ